MMLGCDDALSYVQETWVSIDGETHRFSFKNRGTHLSGFVMCCDILFYSFKVVYGGRTRALTSPQ